MPVISPLLAMCTRNNSYLIKFEMALDLAMCTINISYLIKFGVALDLAMCTSNNLI